MEIGEVEATVGDDGGATVSVVVTNTGERRGSEVIQAYVEPPGAAAARPVRQLAGFAKVELDPGESRTITLTVPPRAFAYWDPAQRTWTVEDGLHGLWVGRSSRDLTEWVAVHPGPRTLPTPQP